MPTKFIYAYFHYLPITHTPMHMYRPTHIVMYACVMMYACVYIYIYVSFTYIHSWGPPVRSSCSPTRPTAVVLQSTNCPVSKITEFKAALYLCVQCVQNTWHGKAKTKKCRDFDTSRTGSWQEWIQIFVVFARVSNELYMQRALSGKVLTLYFYSISAHMGHSACMLHVQPIQNFRRKGWKEGTAWESWALGGGSDSYQKGS
jgi:hypothetical protein